MNRSQIRQPNRCSLNQPPPTRRCRSHNQQIRHNRLQPAFLNRPIRPCQRRRRSGSHPCRHARQHRSRQRRRHQSRQRRLRWFQQQHFTPVPPTPVPPTPTFTPLPTPTFTPLPTPTETPTPTPVPSVQVTKSAAPNPVQVGQTITWTIEVLNIGTTPITVTRIYDLIAFQQPSLSVHAAVRRAGVVKERHFFNK